MTRVAGRIRAAVVVICLVATSCSVAFGDDTEAALLDAADEAALATRAAESVNTAAAAALRDAQARSTSARVRMDDAQRALEANRSSRAFAEWTAAFEDGQAASAELLRSEATAGEAHRASWKAQLMWVEALLAVEEHRSGGPIPSIEELRMGILADLAREMISLVEERNKAAVSLGATQTRLLQDRAERLFDRADAEVYQAAAQWAAAVEAATRYGGGG